MQFGFYHTTINKHVYSELNPYFETNNIENDLQKIENSFFNYSLSIKTEFNKSELLDKVITNNELKALPNTKNIPLPIVFLHLTCPVGQRLIILDLPLPFRANASNKNKTNPPILSKNPESSSFFMIQSFYPTSATLAEVSQQKHFFVSGLHFKKEDRIFFGNKEAELVPDSSNDWSLRCVIPSFTDALDFKNTESSLLEKVTVPIFIKRKDPTQKIVLNQFPPQDASQPMYWFTYIP